MQMKYTEEKLNTFSKETLIQLFLTQQEQLSEIDGKLQLVLEQLAVMNQNRFGRKTEQMPVETFWGLTPLREDKFSKEFINIW